MVLVLDKVDADEVTRNIDEKRVIVVVSGGRNQESLTCGLES